MKAIVGGRVLLPDREAQNQALLFDEKIIGLANPDSLPKGCEVIDASGLVVSPGLVDIHIHGYLGEDASDGSGDGIRKMARGIAENGVTSWCPTTMTVEKDQLSGVFEMMRGLREESQAKAYPGAEILGVHAEGPFINKSKKGAQSADNILPPDSGWILSYQDIVNIVTFAPEMDGAMDFIQTLHEKTNILLSMGHTDATYEIAMEAIRRGLSHVTHTFNAMTPLNHRAPGAVGAALLSAASAELIADCFHVHPALFTLLARMKGDKLVLITDCTRAGGLADGTYDLGGQAIYVKGIECRLADGTIAGSVLKLNNAVANVHRETGLPLYQVAAMASKNPAAAIGAEAKGALIPGKDADIILVDENFQVKRTIIRGETVFQV